MQPLQEFGHLCEGPSAYRGRHLEEVTVTIEASEQSVTLEVDPAPAPEELEPAALGERR